MKIALTAPPWCTVPPRACGRVALLVAGLADGLVARGHQVLVVSAGPQGTRARGFRTLDEPATDRLGDEVTSLLHASIAEEALRDFEPDVVSDHTLPGLAAAEHRRCPTVATVHGPITGAYARLVRRSEGAELVAVSVAQRRSAPEISWRATVPQGVPVRSYPFVDRKGDHLLFLGRMHPDAGVRQAIEVAERSGSHLVIAGRMSGRDEEEYFDTVVRPRLSSTIEFVGELVFQEKVRLLGSARALILPLQWEDPCGLVVAEAQACGTPVLSLRRGAIPELVRHGSTGYVREHHLELVDDVHQLARIDHHACRAHALDDLDIAQTVRAYEAVFATTVAATHGRDRRATRIDARPPGWTPVTDVRTATVGLTPRVPHLVLEEYS